MPVFVPHPSLAKLLGCEELRSEAASVGALLEEVRGRVSPDAWKQAMRATVLVNGRNIHALRGFETRLAPTDEVWMVFPSAGG